MAAWRFFNIGLVCAALCSCVAPIPHPRETATIEQEAKRYTPVTRVAKIYIYNGFTKFPVTDRQLRFPFAYYINDNLVGIIDRDEFLYMTITPGTYNIRWVREKGEDGSEVFTFVANGGDVIFLRSMIDDNGSSNFGVLGAALISKSRYVERLNDGRPDLANRFLAKSTSNVIDAGSPPPVLAPASVTQQQVPALSGSIEEKLSELKRMKDKGLISDAEYEAKKKALLDRM